MPRPARNTLSVELSAELLQDLKTRAFAESMRKGDRVTVSDLVRRYVSFGLGMDRGKDRRREAREAKRAAAAAPAT